MKKIPFILFFLTMTLTMNAGVFAAGETPKKENGVRLAGSVFTRGAINLFTFPGEIVRTAVVEKENHPKAVYVTYVPRVFGNLATRLVSSVNDIGVLPWYVWATNDKRPITNFFDMPDYVWEKF